MSEVSVKGWKGKVGSDSYLRQNLYMSPTASSHTLPASYEVTALHIHAPVTLAKPFDLRALGHAISQA